MRFVLWIWIVLGWPSIALASEWKVREFSTDKFEPLDNYFGVDAVIYYHLEVPADTPQSGGFNRTLELFADDELVEYNDESSLQKSDIFMKDWSELGGRHTRARIRVALPKAQKLYSLKVSVSACDQTFETLTEWSQTVPLQKRTSIPKQPVAVPIEIRKLVPLNASKTRWELFVGKPGVVGHGGFEMVKEVGGWDDTMSYFWTIQSHNRQLPSQFTWGFGRRNTDWGTWRTTIELRPNTPKNGELWLKGQISADGSWPQEIQIPLRDLTGQWIPNPEKWAVTRPVAP